MCPSQGRPVYLRLPDSRDVSQRSSRKRRILITILAIAVLTTSAFWGGGCHLFFREHQDPVQLVDAIVVLGGDDDGREAYGLSLAQAGYADTLVVSNPYPYHAGSDPIRRAKMRQLCRSSTSELKVICFEPEPATTAGEAQFVHQVAESRGWDTVMVVSWRYHLVRARFIFRQCFSGEVVMRSVPRSYDRTPSDWAYVFAYQYAGFGKAAARGCT
ncbi:YdcF family protein [Gordonia hongkongensis]|uniref:YdcF family protein n=1 Tax=Gordonia hongkongensis TaxID=1701090 RepID=A0ABT6BPI7_9ACTN|nr:YdcF family protein [Gordonia hongkongensis]MDF6099776.1 YdcF family protein [Gordonia hongkongensis]